jgi:hypothetical protein
VPQALYPSCGPPSSLCEPGTSKPTQDNATSSDVPATAWAAARATGRSHATWTVTAIPAASRSGSNGTGD